MKKFMTQPVDNMMKLKSYDSLMNSAGVQYRDFRNTLTPKYTVVWLHISLAYLAFFTTAFLITFIAQARISLGFIIITIVTGSFIFGYTIAHLQLFLHEAAHLNVAKNKKVNDFLSNIFIGSIVGQNIKEYRCVHSGHHRYFGTTQDTEHTYFFPLNTKFIVESLLGIKVINVLTRRGKFINAVSDQQARREEMLTVSKPNHKPQTQNHKIDNAANKLALKPKLSPSLLLAKPHFLAGILLNGAIMASSLWFGVWSLAVAWSIGMLVFFPFFAALRQVLEHRDEKADNSINYHTVTNRAVNRLFGDGPISSTFGGAGFNRHMLHHWDPQISYTRLRELEEYLMDTPAANMLRQRKTTYVKAFMQLFSF